MAAFRVVLLGWFLAVPLAAQTFLTEKQALELAFPKKGQVTTEEKRLTTEERDKLQKQTGLRFLEASHTFFINRLDGRVDAYAVIVNEIGKSEPITFMVAIDSSGKVRDVGLMVFRESRGWEVRERRFMNQFRGKRASDPLRVNQDVLNYTGATLSSQAVARGVKKALVLVERFFLTPGGKRAAAGAGGPRLVRELRWVMGSPARITVYAADEAAARRAIAAGFAEMERLDALLSDYRESSELSRVNREAGRAPVAVSRELFALLAESQRVSKATGGAFDITVGSLLRGGARECVGYRNLRLDPVARTVRFGCPGTLLDLGGIGKGYAAERAARALERAGVRRALVNLGGSSFYAVGAPPGEPDWGELHSGEQGWPIAIEDSGEVILLRGGEALSTSGNYRRSHIVDPRTGRPAPAERIATVICRSGALSDALTKPLLLADHAGLARRFPTVEWLLLESSKFKVQSSKLIVGERVPPRASDRASLRLSKPVPPRLQ